MFNRGAMQISIAMFLLFSWGLAGCTTIETVGNAPAPIHSTGVERGPGRSASRGSAEVPGGKGAVTEPMDANDSAVSGEGERADSASDVFGGESGTLVWGEENDVASDADVPEPDGSTMSGSDSVSVDSLGPGDAEPSGASPCELTEVLDCPNTPFSNKQASAKIAAAGAGSLAGGKVPEGGYVLTGLTLYPESMLAPGETLPGTPTVLDSASTGSARFEDGKWRYSIQLDVTIDVLGVEVQLEDLLSGGGCWLPEANLVTGDSTPCGTPTLSGEYPEVEEFEMEEDKLYLRVDYPKESIYELGLETGVTSLFLSIFEDDLPILLKFDSQ